MFISRAGDDTMLRMRAYRYDYVHNSLQISWAVKFITLRSKRYYNNCGKNWCGVVFSNFLQILHNLLSTLESNTKYNTTSILTTKNHHASLWGNKKFKDTCMRDSIYAKKKHRLKISAQNVSWQDNQSGLPLVH